MKARKILLWAATGWTPMLIFIASVFVLYATLHSHFMWVQLAGLLLCGSSGIFLTQTMPGHPGRTDGRADPAADQHPVTGSVP